ncbi:MAG TPA: class A beta-lactamase [Steroidobacteraceae bacterium]|nr:class A beta-lactamase [Steroidobacteraceae bacterium]
MNRRDVLCSTLGLLASPALAQSAPIAALTDYERDTGGHIGVYAKNLRTGALLSWRAHERFIMCSSFKASLAACVLASVDRGQARLDELIAYGPADLLEWAPVAKQNLEKGAMSVAEMCEAAVELSDNTCANALLARFGGPSALTGYWRSIGDTVSRLDHNEPELNRTPPGDPHDTTTPAAMAGTLQKLILGEALLPTSRERLTGWMLGCKTGDNRLRAGLPKDWRVADKTGNNGKDASGDIAVTWSTRGEPMVICAYTRGGAPTSRQIDDVFAQIGRYVGTQLSAAV